MIKARIVLIWLLFAMTILYPAVSIMAVFWEYCFELKNIPVFAVAIYVLSHVIICFEAVCEKLTAPKAMRIMLAVIVPISLINACYYNSDCQYLSVNLAVRACMLFSAGCCCFLTVRYGKPIILKIMSLLLSAMMIIPVILFSFFSLFWKDIYKTEVVQTVESPGGKYYAEVIDYDKGALGGHTYVNICEKDACFDTVLFKIEKRPKLVYKGDWAAFKDMKIHWKDDGCLVINSSEYDMHRLKQNETNVHK